MMENSNEMFLQELFWSSAYNEVDYGGKLVRLYSIQSFSRAYKVWVDVSYKNGKSGPVYNVLDFEYDKD